MRRQLISALGLALILGILIMLVVRCGPQRMSATTIRTGTPTKTVLVKGTPSPAQPLVGTVTGRPTEVIIAPPGAEPSPTPITVGPVIVPATQAPPTVAPAAPTATTAAASSNTPAPSSSSGRRTYTVQRGDTLSKIARQFGTTVDAIVRANNIKDRNKIYVGQKLIIP